MSNNGNHIPAGWYDDPSSPALVRWWDGTNWTEQTMPKAPAAPTPAPQMHNAPGAPSAFNAPAHNSFGSMSSAGDKPANFLWQSIVATLLCCLPLGIAAIVFASKVDSAWTSGQYEVAQDAARKAKMFTFISIGVGAVVVLLYIVLGILGAAATDTSY
jgi:hypothetical protein